MPTDADDTLFPFSLPSIDKKKIIAAFDAGQISSDGGVLLLAGADKRLGLIDALADRLAEAGGVREAAIQRLVAADVAADTTWPLLALPSIWHHWRKQSAQRM